MDPESDPLAPVLFDIASDRVDNFDLKLIFMEAAKNLFMDYHGLNFQQYQSELKTYWQNTEWITLQESLKVPEHVALAVMSAKMKLLLLEKRVHE